MVRINLDKAIDLSKRAKSRFWSYVDIKSDAECWEWKASRNRKGYGQFGGTIDSKRWVSIASRYAYQAMHGKITKPLLVLHSCDSPPCCNPAHLRLGTVKENAADMVASGRQTKGSTRPLSKLTEDQVEIAEVLWRSGHYTQAELAAHLGVNQSQISRAINRRRWKHVPTERAPRPKGKRSAQARIVTFRGETKRLTAFIKELGLNWGAVDARLKRGWSVERTLGTPITKPHKKRAA